MAFLRTLFWIVVTVVVVVFSLRNWVPVTVSLFGNLQADVKLPVLLLIAFLLGFVPLYVWHRVTRWRHGRALTAERLVATPPPPIATRRAASARRGRIEMSSRIYVALDTPDLKRALGLAERVKGHVGGLKLGLEFFCAQGQAGVREVAALGLPIFLDLKLHDIPNTVASAVQALHELSPAILTVHAAGGRAMLEDAKAAAPPSCRVVAVTMLTSLDASDLAATGVAGDAHAQVARLAGLAREAGLDGVVCSGAEVAAAHKAWRDGFFVVPGLRPAGGAMGDQKRAVTPRQACDAGASILVIGRPITKATDPDMAAREIAATL